MKLSCEELRERNRVRCRAYQARNREKVLAQRREHYRKVMADPASAAARRGLWETYRLENRQGMRDAQARWRAAHPDSSRVKSQEWERAHPERARAFHVRYYKANIDKINLRAALHRAKPDVQERYRKRYKAWVAKNLNRLAAKATARRALKMKATPKWADLSAIQCFYDLVPLVNEETGVSHHVDHIVPLKSALVCGLHCEANLQILPASENLSKNNRWWPDMPVAA